MNMIQCSRCDKPHDIDSDGGTCMVCLRVVCGICSQWEEARAQRECRACEYRLSCGQGTWTWEGVFLQKGVSQHRETQIATKERA